LKVVLPALLTKTILSGLSLTHKYGEED
jgi:hypothetical protein